MIKSLRLVNFKNFADETLDLGPFTLIVGANASGKSNIRDAFRFLHGIGRGSTLAEILGGKNSIGWQPIRGATNEIIRFGQNDVALQVEMQLTELPEASADNLRYLIQVRRDDENDGQFRVATESLHAGSSKADPRHSAVQFTSDLPLDYGLGANAKERDLLFYLPPGNQPIEVDSGQPGLAQLDTVLSEYIHGMRPVGIDAEKLEDILAKFRARLAIFEAKIALSGMRFLELLPERMREPSVPGATVLGDSGENLPTVLKAICANPHRKAVLLSWLHELTPMDVSNLEFPIDFNGRVNLRIREANGRAVSAYSASDGTLRFLGMLAALLSDEFEGLYFLEEIDNGIHPARLHLLLDLIERQTAKGKIQVVATTHSPDVLNLINDTTFEDSVVVYRDEQSADAIIRRVAELPNARELRKSQGLGRLHTSGWMENILSFAEADKEDRQDGA